LSIFRSGLIGLLRDHSDNRQVDGLGKRQSTAIRDDIGRHRTDRAADDAGANQNTTLDRGDVNVEVSSW
jgi:hypothetical protein